VEKISNLKTKVETRWGKAVMLFRFITTATTTKTFVVGKNIICIIKK
jgi:hypothetical protein